MARYCAAICTIIWVSQALAVDRPAVLLTAKTDYLKQASEARTGYLKAIDAEIARLQSAGDEEKALELRTHRGEWLLGDITAEEYREFDGDSLPPEHLASVDAYIAAHAECRQKLEAAYESIIKEATFIKRDEEAAEYEQELASLREGTYIPTPVEVIKPKPYEIRRIALEPPLAMPAAAARVPDELFVEFREHGFCIQGVKRTDTAIIDGQERVDFGKGVAFLLKGDGIKKLRGYLMIGALDEEGTYSFFTANKTKFTPILALDELELDTVYEWSVEANRDQFRVEVRHNGEVVGSTRAFGGQGAVFGFCATVAKVDSEARIVVAVE